MSILKTFLILFDSDASGVKKGAAEAEATTTKLNKKLSETNTISGKLGSGFKNLIAQASGALLAAFSVGAIVSGISAASHFADRLDELSLALNISVEDLSVWGDVITKKGGSVEAFQETLKHMTGALTAFAVKGKSRISPFFQEIGIAMVDAKGKARSFLDIMPELADKFEKLGKEESFGIGQKMGLDAGTIMALQLGRREIEALVARHKELGVVTQKDAQIAAAFNDQWDDTKQIFRSLFISLNSALLPALTSLLVRVEKVFLFLRDHAHLVKGALIAIGSAIAYYVTPAIVGMLVAFAPFLAIGAAIAGVISLFAILYDDLMNFYEGNDSLIGELIKKWPLLGEILKHIERLAVRLKELFLNIPNAIKWAWEGIVAIVKNSIGAITDMIGGVLKIYDKVKSFAATIPAKTEISLVKGKTFLNLMGQTPLAAQTSNSISSSSASQNKNTSVQTGPITINTQATDADGIAGAFSTSLNAQMQQANSNFDDGVLA